MAVSCLITNWLWLKYGLFQVKRVRVNINQGIQSSHLRMADGWETVADSRMTWLECNIFKNTSFFLCGWFAIPLPWLVPQFYCNWVLDGTYHITVLYCVSASAMQLSMCHFHKSDFQPQLRFFFPHAPLTTYFTSGEAPFYDCVWNGTSDMPVHILGTLKLQHCTANQSCSVVIWTAHPPPHCALKNWQCVYVFSVWLCQ